MARLGNVPEVKALVSLVWDAYAFPTNLDQISAGDATQGLDHWAHGGLGLGSATLRCMGALTHASISAK